MNATSYWYTRDGRLSEHIIPPSDPYEMIYAVVETSDKGYGRTAATVTIYVHGKPVTEETFLSQSPYERMSLRKHAEQFVKNHLKDQRKITEWVTSRKPKKSTKSKTKRKSNK